MNKKGIVSTGFIVATAIIFVVFFFTVDGRHTSGSYERLMNKDPIGDFIVKLGGICLVLFTCFSIVFYGERNKKYLKISLIFLIAFISFFALYIIYETHK